MLPSSRHVPRLISGIVSFSRLEYPHPAPRVVRFAVVFTSTTQHSSSAATPYLCRTFTGLERASLLCDDSISIHLCSLFCLHEPSRPAWSSLVPSHPSVELSCEISEGKFSRVFRSSSVYCDCLRSSYAISTLSVGLLSYAQSCPFNFDATGSRRHGVRALGESHLPVSQLHHASLRRTGLYFRAASPRPAMLSRHPRSAVSYVSLNPVRCRLVSSFDEWRGECACTPCRGRMTAGICASGRLWPLFVTCLVGIVKKSSSH